MNNLKKMPIWVCWKRVIKPGEKDPTKPPYNPKTGGGAMSNKPSTWATYEQAEAACGNYDGLGFMFTDDICGIDIDGINSDPTREQRAHEIIALMDSYTEQSPSGTGYHIIFRADISKIPEDYKKRYFQKNVLSGIECYLSGKTNRYFTYTGKAINNLGVEDRTEQLLSFLNLYMERPAGRKGTKRQDGTSPQRYADNKTLIEKARRAKNGPKFQALFDNGDISGYNGDDSSADQALCNILAWWTRGDVEWMDELFRMSALYRDKWEREDYRSNTMSKGIEMCGGGYYTGNDFKLFKEWPGAIYVNPFETPEMRYRYPWNDIGMGNLFADTYKGISRYVPEAKAWYIYDGRKWKKDEENMIVAEQAKSLTDYMLECSRLLDDEGYGGKSKDDWIKFVAKMRDLKYRTVMLKDAASVYPVSILEFDKNPYIFNCQNCTLDLRDFTKHDHRADDLLSKISNAIFDPGQKNEPWLKFFDEVMSGDKDKAKFLQKALGYALTGDTSEECMFTLYGSTTRNGKTTTMETIRHMMGDYGMTVQPETIAIKQSPNSSGPTEDLARLKGARFVNMSEPDKTLRVNAAVFKQLTGGNSVTARFLHENSFTYLPEYKLFLDTNHLPIITDDTVFKSERLHVIGFARHFTKNEQDKTLKTRLRQPENISGILNWCIEGLKLMREEGLNEPESVSKDTEQYEQESDTIGLFMAECLVKTEPQLAGIEVQTPLKEIHDVYKTWCEDYGYRNPLSSRNLAADMRTKGITVKNGAGNKVCVFNYRTAITDYDDLPVEWRRTAPAPA